MLSSSLTLLLFLFTSSYLYSIITYYYTKHITIYIIILYSLCISLSLSLFAIYILVVKVVLSHYNFLLYLISNNEEQENYSAVL